MNSKVKVGQVWRIKTFDGTADFKITEIYMSYNMDMVTALECVASTSPRYLPGYKSPIYRVEGFEKSVWTLVSDTKYFTDEEYKEIFI